MTSAFQQILQTRAPKALAAGKVSGDGVYALLSCPEADGVRKVVCHTSSNDRQRQLEKWDRQNRCIAEGDCQGDHRILNLA
jgi:hypothetical protein